MCTVWVSLGHILGGGPGMSMVDHSSYSDSLGLAQDPAMDLVPADTEKWIESGLPLR